MRQGMNPKREEAIERKLPPELPVVVVLTHLPETTLSDYHRQRLEIVQASLTLARQNAGIPHYFVVWDNGSCDILREWLIDFNPDQLILSENIGVLNAMRRIMGMYHDSIVAYSNDDIIYYPDWLPEQVHILQTYPNVGTVSGCVTRHYTGKADDATFNWMRNNARLYKVETPIEWDLQHGVSIGLSEDHTRRVYRERITPACEYVGVHAIIGGNHCQFVCYASQIYPLLHRTDRYMQPLYSALDIPMNEAGMLRLLTTTRRTRHIGNVLSDEDRKEINELVEPVNP